MRKRYSGVMVGYLLTVLILLLSFGTAHSFQLLPRLRDEKQHRVGKLWVETTNFGQIGSAQRQGAIYHGPDYQQSRYINRGGLLFGGIVEADGSGRNPVGSQDTLVSEGPSMWSIVDFSEMLPLYPDSRSLIEVRSPNPASEFFHPDAVSDEDFIAAYTDIFTGGSGLGPAKHERALGIEIIEKSYAYTHVLLEDIVFIDIEVKNIGEYEIKQFYIGFFGDNDMSRSNTPGVLTNGGSRDDAGGFMEKNSVGVTVNTAWVAEPDGDMGNMPSVVGVKILYPTTLRLSYNWWGSNSDVSTSDDWGPRSPDWETGVIDPQDPYGSPEDDENKYVVMVNGSRDPDQFNFDTMEFNQDIPAGADPNDPSRFMISVGPLGTPTGATYPTPRGGEPETLFKPGESIRFVYAIIGGEGDARISRALQSTDPAAFDDLGYNAFVAQQFFDLGYSFGEKEEIPTIRTIPEYYKLLQNYPNPFNPTTTIGYHLPENTIVRVEIFNFLGQKVKTLINNQLQDAGEYSVNWDGTNYSGVSVSSGVYIYYLITHRIWTSKKMLLIR